MKNEKEIKFTIVAALVGLALMTALFVVDQDKDFLPNKIEELILDAFIMAELLAGFLLIKTYLK